MKKKGGEKFPSGIRTHDLLHDNPDFRDLSVPLLAEPIPEPYIVLYLSSVKR